MTIVGWTFDRDNVTFDAEVPTWDGGLFFSAGRLILDDGTVIPLDLFRLRVSGISFNRTMFRSPYGEVWHQSGDARRGVEQFTVETWVIDDENGITSAAFFANQLLNDAPRTVLIETGNVQVVTIGLINVSRSPIESGYRLALTFGSLDGMRV